jgi:branched-chain amino acid aminotransferase
MNFVLADLEANDVDPNSWPAILDLDGNIAEGIGFNIWIVTDGVLKSPDDKTMLQGISRKNILELARQLDIPVVTENIQLYDVYNADEVFISVTSPCILPVSKIDSRPLDGNYPGPIANRLLSAWSEKIGIDIIGQCKAQVALK